MQAVAIRKLQSIDKVLSQRELVQPEPELSPDIVNRFKMQIHNQKQKK